MDEPVSSKLDKSLDDSTDELAQYSTDLWLGRNDVFGIVKESSRRNGSYSAGQHDRTANLLLVRATIKNTTFREKMTFQYHGRTHRLCFNWRGSLVWLGGCSILIVVIESIWR